MKLKNLLDLVISEMHELTPLEHPDFRLEQAEYKDREKIWEIVVSFLVPNTNKKFMSDLTSFQFHRMYKRVKINEKNEVIGFYIFDNKE